MKLVDTATQLPRRRKSIVTTLLVGVFALVALIGGGATSYAATASSARPAGVLASCNGHSWAGIFTDNGSEATDRPGSLSIPFFFNITHTGVVQPHTAITYIYVNTNPSAPSGAFTTRNTADDNCVLRQEPNTVSAASIVGPGTYNVQASFFPFELNGTRQITLSLGQLTVT